MNETITPGTTPAITKRIRQPGQQWVRFGALMRDERFYLGRYNARKVGFISAVVLNGKPEADRARVWPWTKVRSQRPVKATPVKS